MLYNRSDNTDISDKVLLSIGSIQYIHVPRFLKDLAASVSLFQGAFIVCLFLSIVCI